MKYERTCIICGWPYESYTATRICPSCRDAAYIRKSEPSAQAQKGILWVVQYPSYTSHILPNRILSKSASVKDHKKRRVIQHSKIDDETILEAIRLQAALHGGYITNNQYVKSKQLPSYSTIQKRFKSFVIARELALKNTLGRQGRERIRGRMRREERIKLGLCPQCGKAWSDPESSKSGKTPKHCRRCQIYYEQRYKSKTSPAGRND